MSEMGRRGFVFSNAAIDFFITAAQQLPQKVDDDNIE
jgi:hypothetical protein